MTDEIQILPSSPRALKSTRKYNWPFDKLDCGQSFRVENKNIIKFQTLRSMCSYKGKSFNPPRHFKPVEHEDCYEVARLK